MKILVDMDEVLADFLPKACHYHRKVFGSDVRAEDITAWELPGDRLQWEEIFRMPGFFADLDWTDPEAPKYLRKLKEDGHRLHIVTSPATAESCSSKYYWVHTRLVVPGILDGVKKNLTITGDKAGVAGDIIIDDKLGNLEHPTAVGIAYDRPWNKEWEGYRAYDWRDVYAHILHIEDERERERRREEYRGTPLSPLLGRDEAESDQAGLRRASRSREVHGGPRFSGKI